jgi:hypothetical protein
MAIRAFHRRRFLNRRGHHAGAYVIADCRVASYRERREVDATLTIADCNRVAVLDFSAADEVGVVNSLHKARLLRDIVVDFTAALEAAVDEIRQQE